MTERPLKVKNAAESGRKPPKVFDDVRGPPEETGGLSRFLLHQIRAGKSRAIATRKLCRHGVVNIRFEGLPERKSLRNLRNAY